MNSDVDHDPATCFALCQRERLVHVRPARAKIADVARTTFPCAHLSFHRLSLSSSHSVVTATSPAPTTVAPPTKTAAAIASIFGDTLDLRSLALVEWEDLAVESKRFKFDPPFAPYTEKLRDDE